MKCYDIKLIEIGSEMLKIEFNTHKFDTIICLNGELPEQVIFSLLPDAKIIAADGAANSLMAMGIVPHYLVGDLDSVSEGVLKVLFKQISVFHYGDQDYNDFEKSLVFATIIKAKNILILGSNGGLFEHSINNWSVFARYAEKMNLTIYESGRYGFAMNKSFSFEAKNEETLSIIPQSKAKLKTKNLVWELNSEYLELGKREGARNRAKDSPIEIDILEGSILFFCESRLPYSPFFVES